MEGYEHVCVRECGSMFVSQSGLTAIDFLVRVCVTLRERECVCV